MKTVIEEVKSNWTLIAFMCAMVIWYANTNSRLNNVEAEQIEQKTAIEQITDSYNSIKTDLSSIKTDIGWIKNNIK